MSSTENKAEVVTNKVEENVQEKEKGAGDLKSETSPQKRTASELNSAEDDEVKQKVLKKKKMGNLRRSMKKEVKKMMRMKRWVQKERVMILMRKVMKMELTKRRMKMKMMHKHYSGCHGHFGGSNSIDCGF
ncbi:uncharacterized protein LOC106457658 isoform X1 [Limulus polyphemus]|uniref:Uncharacterized protein LOC106457658 isoform X1 n=1 Tax=Limulus polyphemus TaxID=6850 RepID=A0ABM1S6V2_LIMPO|nr:uncharacterized protein LOC106457658 isoform X1 [Limulus polyphemus]